MKPFLIATFICLFSGACACDVSGKGTDELLVSVRLTTGERSKDSNSQSTIITVKGNAIVWEQTFDGAAIVKIAVINNGETNSFFEEFYYSKEKLIFVYRKQEIYDEPMSKVARTKENRFYFNDGELIRWVNENGKQVATSNSEYAQRRLHYLGLSRLLIEGARSRQSMIEAPERTP